MKRLAILVLCGFLFCAAGQVWTQAAGVASQTAVSQAGVSQGVVTLPAGTKVELSVISPVRAKTAMAGDPLYTQTNFPVTAGAQVAIPPGTWVQGRIEKITRPTGRQAHAELEVVFRKIVFANGYTVLLPKMPVAGPNGTVNAAANAASPAATAVLVTVNVSAANDLLLDNGAPVEMTLAAPLTLDAGQVAAAQALSHPPGQLAKFRSATQCVPTPETPGTPGTPGTPDTVIPGTPSTVIPGAPGMPDTVIPGTPATVIPGSPGTPGTPETPGAACPQAPLVVSSVPIVPAPKPSATADTNP